jgi:hypothetical protein
MKFRTLFVMMIAAGGLFQTGCVNAFGRGVSGGVSSATEAVVVTIVESFLAQQSGQNP